ncbi:MAG: hypothetical protein KGP28_10915 [Bdellovibrionales bacterium]|nr:hypothetical protein [Bdellovibrionales bacterium]
MKKSRKLAKARLLTPIQLKMLDAGQPVVVVCQTPSGVDVEVRLQTAVLDLEAEDHSQGCWFSHGVYVAVLSEPGEAGKHSSVSSSGKGYTTLPMAQMYRVLRGLPGRLKLTSESGEKFTVTYFNPNAPANRCYETKGLSISLEFSEKSGGRGKKKSISKELTSKELRTLRSGKPLDLSFGGRVLTLQSNTGGQLVQLPVARTKSIGHK